MARSAIVTGAASGIGRATAEALARRGARVVLADLDGEAAERAAAEVGGDALAAALDVADAAAFATLVGSVVERHGGLDLLVNNAGTAVFGEAQDIGPDHWGRVIDVNLKGVAHGVSAAYPGMVERGAGQIVNVASIAGLLPAPLITPYAASKHGVVGLSLSLRQEAASHGVGITCICPAAIDTPLLDRTAPEGFPTLASAPDPRRWVSEGVAPPSTPEALAERILRAIDRNEALVVFPGRARLLASAARLAPRLVWAYGERRVRRR